MGFCPCSWDFKSFSYLYNEEQFISALAKDVKIIRTLPKNIKGARREEKIQLIRVPYQVYPYFYLHHVLPVLNKHSVVELVINNGGCLQCNNVNKNIIVGLKNIFTFKALLMKYVGRIIMCKSYQCCYFKPSDFEYLPW
ncbi:hypothetical protein SAY87_009054 [Trapa incisa]|uniref:O-fucosyltransferase family protein n=1 Tax=Trapa incisa TaxID=236973 RepID=A0AAN7PW74_9MYRT|nr:hypothetical protein SAY87_009054 [Trapa incisa]